MRKWTLAVVCLQLLFYGACIEVAAGESSDAKRDAKSTRSATSGRLPRYFGQLDLEPTQRSRVYAIQADYRTKMEKLRSELSRLEQQRAKDLHKVLKPAQRKKWNLLSGGQSVEKRSDSSAKKTRGARRGRKRSASTRST